MLEPMLGTFYQEAKLPPKPYTYPLPVKKRILPGAMIECISNSRTVEAKTKHHLEDVNRAQGVK